MNRLFFAAAIAATLLVAGCDDDDDDYSYSSENCRTVDYGEGEEYELCCILRCYGEYDWDEAYENCSEEYTCASRDGGPCPEEVIRIYRYPECIY